MQEGKIIWQGKDRFLKRRGISGPRALATFTCLSPKFPKFFL